MAHVPSSTRIIKRNTANHWGAAIASIRAGQLVALESEPDDLSPSRINENVPSSLNGRARVLRPVVRRGWLKYGPTGCKGGGADRAERGFDSFVELPWDEALDLIAAEIQRVRTEHGNEAIFAGSYGWSSAGRFHHAQGQLKRFLNCVGGFTASEGNYSYNAALVLMPHILGDYTDHVLNLTRWSVVRQHTDLVVMFGGIPERNMQVSDGGMIRHRGQSLMRDCANGKTRFINISPLREDGAEHLQAEWLSPRPGTDTAIMLALCHTLWTEGLYDQSFLDRYTVGSDRVVHYLMGQGDGQAKSAEWAAGLSGLSPDRIVRLAREMAAGRTLVTCAAGVQRADFGEQPLWATITLAAMLGQIGLPGGGFGIGYGANGNIGVTGRAFRAGALSQGKNPAGQFIPVAMVTEMLENPGGRYQYNGQDRVFPDTRMIWWAGGNPFHHHQDLNRMHNAFQRPETIIVNEFNWTATARRADFVLPVTAPQERTDFAAGKSDNGLLPMPACALPPGQARDEYDIFSDLARRLGCLETFTDGLDSTGWLLRLWEQTREAGREKGFDLPEWDTFIAGPAIEIPDPKPQNVFLQDFRLDPDGHPLPTPSGKIELYCEKIAGYELDDCPGQATWIPPREQGLFGGDAAHPFHLISGQPRSRLHSQLDNGTYSLSFKINGREPVLMHPKDARALGLVDGDVVELFNRRGTCLAGLRLTEDIRLGCLFLWTGAWYDPDPAHPLRRDRHGNPNVLTHDLRTSRLSQGPAAHSASVGIRRAESSPPAVTVHEQPDFVAADATMRLAVEPQAGALTPACPT